MLSVRIQKNEHGEQPCAGIAEAQRDKRGMACRRIDGATVDQRRQKRADHHAGNQLSPAGGKRPYRLTDALHAVSKNKQSSENEEEGQIHIQEGVTVSQRFGRNLVRAQKDPLINAADRKQKPEPGKRDV